MHCIAARQFTFSWKALHAQLVAIISGYSVLLHLIASCLNDRRHCPNIVQRLPVTEAVDTAQARPVVAACLPFRAGIATLIPLCNMMLGMNASADFQAAPELSQVEFLVLKQQ